MSLPRLRAMLVSFSSRTSPTVPTLWHVSLDVDLIAQEWSDHTRDIFTMGARKAFWLVPCRK